MAKCIKCGKRFHVVQTRSDITEDFDFEYNYDFEAPGQCYECAAETIRERWLLPDVDSWCDGDDWESRVIHSPYYSIK